MKINGSFFVKPIQCDGAIHTWSGTASSDNGLFKGGKGASVTFAFACGVFECAVGYAEQTVQLSGAKK